MLVSPLNEHLELFSTLNRILLNTSAPRLHVNSAQIRTKIKIIVQNHVSRTCNFFFLIFAFILLKFIQITIKDTC